MMGIFDHTLRGNDSAFYCLVKTYFWLSLFHLLFILLSIIQKVHVVVKKSLQIFTCFCALNPSFVMILGSFLSSKAESFVQIHWRCLRKRYLWLNSLLIVQCQVGKHHKIGDINNLVCSWNMIFVKILIFKYSRNGKWII